MAASSSPAGSAGEKKSAAAPAPSGAASAADSAPAVHDLGDGTKPAPSALPGEAPVGVPAPGGDPDSIARQAKAQLGVGTLMDDEDATDHLERVGKARALIEERNSASPERVRAIDVELRGLGFTDPLPTTAAQRGPAVGPAGRAPRQGRQSST